MLILALMATVKFTRALKRFYPDLSTLILEGETVADIVNNLEEHYPGLRNYIVDEHGKLRQHVNIFVDNQLVKDRDQLNDRIVADNEIYIMQALSGG